MIAADILKALWKQKKIIALFLAVAVLACYLSLFVGQTHTAAVYIKYLEEKAADGVATNGKELNPYEIADTYIVGMALAQMGMSDMNVNSVAQRIKVKPVFSSAEQEKYASWIDQFSDYEKNEDKRATPVYYKIEFVSKEGVAFARDFLSALIHQYRNYYTGRYSGFSEVAVVSEELVLNSDYFYAVEMLHEQIEDTMSYLSNIVSEDVDYRSPKTGYALSDLLDAYHLLIQTKRSEEHTSELQSR